MHPRVMHINNNATEEEKTRKTKQNRMWSNENSKRLIENDTDATGELFNSPSTPK